MIKSIFTCFAICLLPHVLGWQVHEYFGCWDEFQTHTGLNDWCDQIPDKPYIRMRCQTDQLPHYGPQNDRLRKRGLRNTKRVSTPKSDHNDYDNAKAVGLFLGGAMIGAAVNNDDADPPENFDDGYLQEDPESEGLGFRGGPEYDFSDYEYHFDFRFLRMFKAEEGNAPTDEYLKLIDCSDYKGGTTFFNFELKDDAPDSFWIKAVALIPTTGMTVSKCMYYEEKGFKQVAQYNCNDSFDELGI